jgi:hypothetical protein
MLYLDYSRKAGEWVPNVHGGNEDLDAIAFLKQLNEVAHGREPGLLMAAEESTAWPGVSRPVYLGGLGFGLKWNMGWMHDTLAYFQLDPVYRRYHHHQLTFSLVYAFSENFVLPLSHDEVVHGKGSLLAKMPGDPWQRRANLRAVIHVGSPRQEAAVHGRRARQEASAGRPLGGLLERPGTGISRCPRPEPALPRRPALGRRTEPAGSAGWSRTTPPETRPFMRLEGRESGNSSACNFSPVPRPGYRIGLLRAGRGLTVNTDLSRTVRASGHGRRPRKPWRPAVLGGADAPLPGVVCWSRAAGPAAPVGARENERNDPERGHDPERPDLEADVDHTSRRRERVLELGRDRQQLDGAEEERVADAVDLGALRVQLESPDQDRADDVDDHRQAERDRQPCDEPLVVVLPAPEAADFLAKHASRVLRGLRIERAAPGAHDPNSVVPPASRRPAVNSQLDRAGRPGRLSSGARPPEVRGRRRTR